MIILHNHPSLSKFSLEDVKFFLNNGTVKMMVVVTNLGNISYLVKRENYNRKKAIEIYNYAVSVHYASIMRGIIYMIIRRRHSIFFLIVKRQILYTKIVRRC